MSAPLNTAAEKRAARTVLRVLFLRLVPYALLFVTGVVFAALGLVSAFARLVSTKPTET